MTKTNMFIGLAALGLAGVGTLSLTACGGAAATPVAIAPGFALTQATGNAGGSGMRAASEVDASCAGYIGGSPQHILAVSAALPNLTVMVNGGDADTTLVVHLPDGTYRCNDDTDGLNPVVSGPVGAGNVEIFVGAYSMDSVAAAYTIGFTPDATALPSSMH